MRRLPVYFVVDVSDSMVGAPIEAVKKGLSNFFDALQSDPYALEVAFINLFVFAGKTKKLISMQEAYKCFLPDIYIGSGTNFGCALQSLMDDLDKNINYGTLERKGDWKPLVFFLTDGAPTDPYEKAVQRWNSSYRRKTIPVALSVGSGADVKLLSQLTETVLKINDVNDVNSIKNFFKCVSASVRAASVSVDGTKNGFVVSDQAKAEGLEIVDEQIISRTKVDENVVILRARCQTTKKDYLIKYQLMHEGYYGYVGSYSVDVKEYESLSIELNESNNLDTTCLIGQPTCPHCENEIGLVSCGACHKLFCSHSEGIVTCPWCGNASRLRTVDKLSVERAIG